MEAPTFFGAREVAPETTLLAAFAPLPGLGVLPVNTLVIRAAEPVLADTGMAAFEPAFLAALEGVIDPAALRWVWLSHMDLDHIGNLDAVAERAPNATFVAGYLGAAKLSLRGFDMSRVRVLSPGETLDVGDRTLAALRPPYYDAPEAMGFFDTRTRVLYSVDAFGALLEAPEEDAAAIESEALFDGFARWSALDAPWLAQVDRSLFGRVLAEIERLEPSVLISAHLPPAYGMAGALTRLVMRAIGPTPAQSALAAA